MVHHNFEPSSSWRPWPVASNSPRWPRPQSSQQAIRGALTRGVQVLVRQNPRRSQLLTGKACITTSPRPGPGASNNPRRPDRGNGAPRNPSVFIRGVKEMAQPMFRDVLHNKQAQRSFQGVLGQDLAHRAPSPGTRDSEWTKARSRRAGAGASRGPRRARPGLAHRGVQGILDQGLARTESAASSRRGGESKRLRRPGP